MSLEKPIAGEYPVYYDKYFTLLDNEMPLLEQMHNDTEKFMRVISSLPQDKWHYAYAEGKWTSLQVIQHVIDTERILTYRSLCFARGEKQSLPGFDENAYAAAVNMQNKTPHMVSLEWISVRQATLAFYMGLTAEEAKRTGKANNNLVSINAVAHMTVAHARHHFHVLNERYLEQNN